MDSQERSASANLPCEEPSALDAHARFRGGRGSVTTSPTRPLGQTCWAQFGIVLRRSGTVRLASTSLPSPRPGADLEAIRSAEPSAAGSASINWRHCCTMQPGRKLGGGPRPACSESRSGKTPPCLWNSRSCPNIGGVARYARMRSLEMIALNRHGTACGPPCATCQGAKMCPAAARVSRNRPAPRRGKYGFLGERPSRYAGPAS